MFISCTRHECCPNNSWHTSIHPGSRLQMNVWPVPGILAGGMVSCKADGRPYSLV